MMLGTELPSLSAETKDCISCGSTKLLTEFERDSSIRDGRKVQCYACAHSPRLSTAEHTDRLRELNYAAAENQRHPQQRDMYNDESRQGRRRHHSEIVRFLDEHIPGLFLIDGKFAGDIAMYDAWDRLVYRNKHFYSKPFKPGDPTFTYIGWMPSGYLPEFSLMEFDERDVLVRRKEIGWRTVLLGLIRQKYLTEDQAHKRFGRPSGLGANQYLRELFIHRNGHE